MNTTRFSRMTLMIAGMIAAAIIVFSQSYPVAQKKAEKEKSEQSEHGTTISTPDAVAHSQGIQLDEQTPSSVQEELSSEQHFAPVVNTTTRIFARYFKVLFRTVIASNAP